LIKSLIVAISRNGVIGRANGKMPWHVKEEFQHFKKTTVGYAVIMGRKTFETLGKPLKNRLNIIISRNENYKVDFDDVIIKNSLQEAVDYCSDLKFEKIFIIGGGQIYKQAISFVDEMIISYMKFDAEGDVRFPVFDKGNWKVFKMDDHEKFEIFRYERKN